LPAVDPEPDRSPFATARRIAEELLQHLTRVPPECPDPAVKSAPV
jgi:hypothetical protein